jgi:hypothetical protein
MFYLIGRRKKVFVPLTTGSPFGDPSHLFLILGGDGPLTMEVFDGSSW